MNTSYSPAPVDRSTRIFWKYSASGRIRLVVLMPVCCSNWGSSGIRDSVKGCLLRIIRTVLPLYFCQSKLLAAAAGAVVGAAAGAVVGAAVGVLDEHAARSVAPVPAAAATPTKRRNDRREVT